MNWNKIKDVIRGPQENPSAFLEKFREYLRQYTALDLDLPKRIQS